MEWNIKKDITKIPPKIVYVEVKILSLFKHMAVLYYIWLKAFPIEI